MWFKALESWRGLAALAVVLFHFFAGFTQVDAGRFIRDAYLFVDFFFVLSGFVISHAYAERLRRPGEAGRFILRRFGRLWPVHVMTGLFVVYWLAGLGVRLPDISAWWTAEGLNPFLSNALLLHGTGLNTTLTFNFPSWTISAEFWTYFVFLLLVWLVPPRLVPWLAAILVLGSAAVIFLFAGPVFMDTTATFGLVRAIFGFFTGYFVWLLLRRQGGSGIGGTGPEAAVLALAIGFELAAGYRETPLSILAPLAFAPLVYVFAAGRGLFSALLNTPPLRYLGRISYSLYMVHVPVLIVLPWLAVFVRDETGLDYTWPTIAAAGAAGNLWPLVTVAVVFVAVAILVAGFTYLAIEQPGRRFANYLASRRSSGTVPASDLGAAPAPQ